MSEDPLRLAEAARRLEISTRALLDLMRSKKIRYVMREGIAHIPSGAFDEYQLS